MYIKNRPDMGKTKASSLNEILCLTKSSASQSPTFHIIIVKRTFKKLIENKHQ